MDGDESGAGSAPAEHDLLDAILADRYLIERRIGRTRLGTVYRAEDRVEDRPVGITVLDAAIDPEGNETRGLVRDIEIAAGLVSPNLLPVIEIGLYAQRHIFIVEPLLAGQSVESRLEQEGPQKPGIAMRIAREVLQALSVIHGHDMVHLSVEPSKIFLVKDPLGTERAVLGGLGLHHVLGLEFAQAKETDRCRARPEYVAPEIVTGRELGSRTDIYQVGLILYELLTGRPAFVGNNFRTTARRHALERPLNPRMVRRQAHIPEKLDALVMRCLEKSPDKRFESAGTLARALEAIARSEDILESRTSLSFRNVGSASRPIVPSRPASVAPPARLAEVAEKLQASSAEAEVATEPEQPVGDVTRDSSPQNTSDLEQAQPPEEDIETQAEPPVESSAGDDHEASEQVEAPEAETSEAEEPKAETSEAEEPKAETSEAEEPKAEETEAEAPDPQAPEVEESEAEAPEAAAAHSTESEKLVSSKVLGTEETGELESLELPHAFEEFMRTGPTGEPSSDTDADPKEEASVSESKSDSVGEKESQTSLDAGGTNASVDETVSNAVLAAQDAIEQTASELPKVIITAAQKHGATQPLTSLTAHTTDERASEKKPSQPVPGVRVSQPLPETGQSATENPRRPISNARFEDTTGEWFVESTEQLEAQHARLSHYHFQEIKERNLFPYVLSILMLVVVCVFFLLPDTDQAPEPESDVPDTRTAKVLAKSPTTTIVVGENAGETGSKEATAKIAELENEARSAYEASRWLGSEDALVETLSTLRKAQPDNPVARDLSGMGAGQLLSQAKSAFVASRLSEARDRTNVALAIAPNHSEATRFLQQISVAEKGLAEEEQREQANVAAENTESEAKAKAEAEALIKAKTEAEALIKAKAEAEAFAAQAKQKAEAETLALKEAELLARQRAETQAKLEAEKAVQAAAKNKANAEAKARRDAAAALERKKKAEQRNAQAAARKRAAAERKRLKAQKKTDAAAKKKQLAAQRRAQAAEKKKRVRALVAEGRKHLKSGQYSKASQSFLSAIRENGRSATAYSGLGEVAFKQGKFDKALVHHGKSAKLAPGNADFQVNHGMAYFKLKRYALAKSTWEQALKINPKHKRAARYLRLVEKKLKN